MDAVSYSTFRSQLARFLDKVKDDHKPVLITRQNGRPAIIMSLEDYQPCEETVYLMASPRNAERLNRAVADIEAGNTAQHGLIDSWAPGAWEDYLYWQKTDKKTLKRINVLITDILCSPFDGIGDPEPLKHTWSGYWSRRIDRKHRLVYKATENSVVIVQCHYHY